MLRGAGGLKRLLCTMTAIVEADKETPYLVCGTARPRPAGQSGGGTRPKVVSPREETLGGHWGRHTVDSGHFSEGITAI